MSNGFESVLESVVRRVVREELQALMRILRNDDRLLTADEAAKILSVSTDWLYRRSKRLPFTRKIHHKMIRFSFKGIQKYIADATQF
jgi:predicted DNA-binding transcriptional regulator AlpA